MAVDGENVVLEAIPEIITKKIYHRGASIKARDIFDIAAAGERHDGPIIEALRNYREEVARTLSTLEKLNPVFVKAAIDQLAIKDEYRSVAAIALTRAREILRAVPSV
jgi:hypothetical protein